MNGPTAASRYLSTPMGPSSQRPTVPGLLRQSAFGEQPLARIMPETPSRDRGDGRATGQIRGRSRWFVHNAG
jgi:hypothetical protein